jgi:glycerol-3-phosphate dehydrogenase
VLLNALDASERGAEILTRTAFTSARRENSAWRVELLDQASGARRVTQARCVVNAAGPWVEQVLGRVAGVNSNRRVRLVKGSHIITRKFWEGPQAYVLQNTDKRLIFVNPYQGDLTLIGTTDIPYDGLPEEVACDPSEVAYLLAIINRYFKVDLEPTDVLHSFSGVRPLYDDEATNPSAVTRDYVFEVDGGQGRPPFLSVFGGKITTCRKLAEHALERLRPFFPTMGAPWTSRPPLPGGDIPNGDFDAFVTAVCARRPWLPGPLAQHYARLYGTRLERLLGDASGIEGLGRHFGGQLYEREARYLLEHEWALSAEDILERRTKHYLHLGVEQRSAFDHWLRAQTTARRPAELSA